MLPHHPFVRQTRLELLACILGVLDVDELFMDGRRIVKCGLPAPIYAGHCRPNAHSAPEVISHIQGHHVLDTQAEVCRAFDLRTAEERYGIVNVCNIILVPGFGSAIIIIMYNVCMIIIVF